MELEVLLKLLTLSCICILLIGCRGERLEWVVERPRAECPGGRVNQERRVTDVVAGRTRNTVIRTDACLE